MTRFITYDPEVASRLAQAVGTHRVDLRDAEAYNRKFNPALFDWARDPRHSAALMASSDEQVLVIRVDDPDTTHRPAKKRKKSAAKHEGELKEVGSQPSGFLGLQDEPVFSDEDEPEDPPRSLWKQDE
ncbi:MAG TPA: hypothetical protein VGL89_02935 [Candidatus Koribacter sp.]|jgi:hypothetical protein